MPINICPENAQETSDAPVSEAGLLGRGGGLRGDDAFLPLDTIELEALACNQETSLRVYSDHHFFSWTQGLLQNLIRHEALVCVLSNGESERPLVESYTMAAVEPEHLCQRYRQNPIFSEKMVKDWAGNFFQPVSYDLDGEHDLPATEFLDELNRLGARRLVIHGTHDASGRMSSLFIFACSVEAEEAGSGLLRMVEMMTPFVHAAWVRAKANPCAGGEGGGGAHAATRDLLTAREQEVLKWVYLGKSNIEIGMILGISSLTVKNHVQEILRRLNVQNRAQAVGKAFNLHILSC